jgi:hypothetical protein
MNMLGIINQIDAHLSRLRLAREILVKPLPAPSAKGKKKSTSKKTHIVVSTKVQGPVQSRSKVRRSPGAQKREVPVALIPGSSTSPVEVVASLSDLVSKTVPEYPAPPNAATEELPSLPNINIRRLPYRGPGESIRPLHARRLKVSEPTHGTGALVGSMNSKVVVVSPEQARKEREQTAQPEVQPRSMFKSGLTGRLAFESLFKDTGDGSN